MYAIGSLTDTLHQWTTYLLKNSNLLKKYLKHIIFVFLGTIEKSETRIAIMCIVIICMLLMTSPSLIKKFQTIPNIIYRKLHFWVKSIKSDSFSKLEATANF